MKDFKGTRESKNKNKTSTYIHTYIYVHVSCELHSRWEDCIKLHVYRVLKTVLVLHLRLRRSGNSINKGLLFRTLGYGVNHPTGLGIVVRTPYSSSGVRRLIENKDYRLETSKNKVKTDNDEKTRGEEWS